ncbi:MAG: gamma-glutamyl-gamma-aminobutyrate hydrolase family protein [Thermoanaerobaculia bacterium]
MSAVASGYNPSVRIALTLDRDAVGREANDYVRALLRAGLRPDEIVILAPGETGDGDFDGVVLGGGGDVDPARYGQAARPDANLELDAERDATDFAIFERAWKDRTPVLGICRGLQVVNVALGGTLLQDIASDRPSEVRHEAAPGSEKSRRDHSVRIAPGSRLGAIAGARELPVNSRHHQAIDASAGALAVTATSPDGLVEAIEGRDGRWVLAVQWHPENLIGDGASERLFAEFVDAARERARQRPT